jgi:hypothetical protein
MWSGCLSSALVFHKASIISKIHDHTDLLAPVINLPGIKQILDNCTSVLTLKL